MSREFDVCLSFAGEDRPYVERVAAALSGRQFRVFYDGYFEAQLWGKQLYQHLTDIFQNQAEYCIVFASRAYAAKVWPKLELQAAQARAFTENREYLLLTRFDDTELPGVLATVGYIDLRKRSPEELAELFEKKVRTVTLDVPTAVELRPRQVVLRSDGSFKAPPLAGRDYRESELPVIPGLSLTDVLVLRVLGNAAFSNDSIDALDTEEAWQAAWRSGADREHFLSALETLTRRGLIEPSQVLSEIPPFVSLTPVGFATYASAFVESFPQAASAVKQSILVSGLRRNDEIASAIHEPLVFVDSVLDTLATEGHIDLQKTLGGYVHVVDVRPTLQSSEPGA